MPVTISKMTAAKGLVRACVLTVCCVGALGAQGQSAAPQQQTQQNRDSAKQHHEGIGRQLAHETREAAGEEKDETAEFKQSAPVRWIANKTGMSLQHAYWVCVLLNFVIIAAVILWAGRKYLPGMFRDRTAAIQKAMQEAQNASEEARRRLAEIETRLIKLDVEIGMMRDAAEKEAVGEEIRIKTAAQEDARKIIQSAEQEIAAAAKAARRALTAYAGGLAVDLAQKQIRVDSTTDQALVRGFAGELAAASGRPTLGVSGNGPGDGTGKDAH
ncbi:MAG: ATP synthase F0 subunit B [Candidatus Sulfotelmatobacter sp.]